MARLESCAIRLFAHLRRDLSGEALRGSPDSTGRELALNLVALRRCVSVSGTSVYFKVSLFGALDSCVDRHMSADERRVQMFPANQGITA